MVIKPHSIEGIPVWRRFLASRGLRNVRVTGRHESIERCLANCDAMVLSYWSTALFEAARMGVPCFFLDIRGKGSGVIAEYCQAGYGTVVHDAAELEKGLQGLATGSNAGQAPWNEYYLGPSDQGSSARVASFVLEHSAPMNAPEGR